MSKLSRSALMQLSAQVAATPMQHATVSAPAVIPMTQTQRVADLKVINEDQANRIANILGGDILRDQNSLLAILRAQKELAEDASRVLDAAISMGRSLVDLRKAVGGRFQQVLRHSSELFGGLSKGNASKLMSVADFVDKQQIDMHILPTHYTVIYEFTTLPPAEVEEAVRKGLIRPDISRREVIEWKKTLSLPEIAGTRSALEHDSIRKARLRSELTKLDREERDLEAKLSAVKVRKQEIEVTLSVRATI